MKKVANSLLTLLLLTPARVFAQDGGIPVEQPSRSPGGSLTSLITTISNTILLLVGVIAVLFLIIGGFQYIASAGNPEQIGKAKQTIMYAIIGIIVALLAYVVVKFILGQFPPS